jgi:spore photoproduct lyase
LYANLEDARSQFSKALNSFSGFVRMGTGEFADSLALDPWTGHASWLRDLVASHPRVHLELKTKSANVEALLDRRPLANVVVAWSVNPEERVKTDEGGTASLNDRLRAATRVAAAGYRVAFHFDPIVLAAGWEAAYRGLVGRVFAAVEPDRVAWVSLGTLRFPARFVDRWGPALRGRRIFFDEFVPGEDGKLRYFWPLRREAYRSLAREIRRRGGSRVPIYLCMEPPGMWAAVLGWTPEPGEVERHLTEGCPVRRGRAGDGKNREA